MLLSNALYVCIQQGGAGSQLLRGPDRLSIVDWPGRQINNLLSGKHYPLPSLPAASLYLSRTLEGLFEWTQRPSNTLASCVAGKTTENQRHFLVRGPKTPSGATDGKPDFALVENSLVFVVPKTGGGLGPSSPPVRPCMNLIEKQNGKNLCRAVCTLMAV